jgi:hypothetical protein
MLKPTAPTVLFPKPQAIALGRGGVHCAYLSIVLLILFFPLA